MNTNLHAVTDQSGRPVSFFIKAGQASDYTGAAALMNGLPETDWLLADRGYDADWFREGLVDKGIRPCISGRKSRKTAIKYPFRDIVLQCTAGQWIRDATNDAIVLSACSAASKIGGASLHAMTDHQPSSFTPSYSPRPLYFGYEP
jgi:transposase